MFQGGLGLNEIFVKLNVDAAYFEEEGMGATPAVIRDEKGTFLAAQCKFIIHVVDVMTTEAMAPMRDGLNPGVPMCGGGIRLTECDQLL